ncbi:hypothetical protein FSPOR_7313 [Fusarium sporotrichioides]|uniref:Uncharacterized protein n=1 Tax=Fusarium sporotrichioides TaxID=5514 RepID=A0A395RZ01_FUSSP|nr:hypothetical protein FSPOR_7313 [Fusarium sporotrichioides]
MSDRKDIAASDPQGKGKQIADPAPALKSILKSSQNAPSSPNTSRHVSFSHETNTNIYIPSENRGHYPSGHRIRKHKRLHYDSKDWVIVNNLRIERGVHITQEDACDDRVMAPDPGKKDDASGTGGEIINCHEVMDLSDEDRADTILSEPFEHTSIRLQRHLQRDSETDRM